MKVICIDNKGCENILTIGKEYEMKTIIKTFDYSDDQYEYYVINNKTYWSKKRFLNLDEYRNSRLEDIGI